MIRVVFVCLGNICRSPMAEVVFRDMVRRAGLEEKISVRSRATEPYEEGDGIYPPAEKELQRHGLSAAGHRSVMLKEGEKNDADFFLCMDRANLRDCARILKTNEKQYLLTSFTGRYEEVADPWYTGDFAGVYRQIKEGCEAFLDYLRRWKRI